MMHDVQPYLRSGIMPSSEVGAALLESRENTWKPSHQCLEVSDEPLVEGFPPTMQLRRVSNAASFRYVIFSFFTALCWSPPFYLSVRQIIALFQDS
jgi:hypothetical protein